MRPIPANGFLRALALLTMFAISMDVWPRPIPGRTTSFSQIELIANIETIGIAVTGADLPATVQLLYNRSGETAWRTAHPLVRVDDGRLIGSLFDLSPSTSYNIKITDGASEITATATTQPDELLFIPTSVLHVNDDAAAGGDGSAGAPLQTIQEAVNRAGPGTQVLVADGIYREAVSFPSSGASGNWIQVKAAGSGAVLDGGLNPPPTDWSPVPDKKNLWFTRLGGPTAYVARDDRRFYLYDDYSGLLQARGHNGVSINEGWYYDPGTRKLFVRSQDEPAGHTWHVGALNQAFTVTGRDWIWIEGFEIRYYGIGDGCGVCAKDSSHLVVRRNRIHNLQKGVFFEWTGGEDRANDTRVELNEISDPAVNEWPWSAVKSTSMEGTGITIRGHKGAIVRGNDVHHVFNAIYVGSSALLENPGVAFDADVYNNSLHQIGDDAFEPEGACINVRFHNNTVNGVFVGASFAPVTIGPTWVFRSTFANYTGRGVKWDRNSDGKVLVYHNTFWTPNAGVNGMDFISPSSNSVLRNNIFHGNALSINEGATGSRGNDWNNNNWHTTLGAGTPHFKWENINYLTIANLCSATGLECNGYESPSGLANPSGGNFALNPGSPNIDRGAAIPGINDSFAGSAPDVGAFENAFDAVPSVRSITRADASPTSAASVTFTVVFSEAVTGVDLAAPFQDFVIASSGITGAAIESVTAVSATTYTVRVNTGTGNGSIRLDAVDDDTIRDTGGGPLGGAGAGNGNFGGGESYSVEKNRTVVNSIVRAEADPSSAASVTFTVNFSGPVTGVDSADFSAVASGGLSGAAVASISGTGATYTVIVNTGTGDGTLRLDVLDNDTIVDSANQSIGGTGAGNGNFTSGQSYTINRSAPLVSNIARLDANPTANPTVRFSVTFSETVSGVDASDFGLASTGVSGASIASVSGSGATYTVNVNTGSGSGTLRLDLLDNDSIVDAAASPLAGAGAGNGTFTTGQSYTVNKNITILSATFTSNGTADGWILESNEDSNQGGYGNSSAATFNLGDDASDRQYRAILHFPTSALPDNAVVTMVIVSMKLQGISGSNPFTTHQSINVDIKSGYFGSSGLFGFSSLDLSDFQSAASRNMVGQITNNPVGGWYWTTLDPAAYPYVNRTGVTQLRLFFLLDDNDDRGEDYLRYFSGNASVTADRPQLQVQYYVPK